MDVFWFRIAKRRATTGERCAAIVEPGGMVVLIDRGDYWQCAFLIPKGAAEAIRRAGIERDPRRSRRRRFPDLDSRRARTTIERPPPADRRARPADALAPARACWRSATPPTPCRRSAASASTSPSRTRSPPPTSSPARWRAGEDVDRAARQGAGAAAVSDPGHPGRRRKPRRTGSSAACSSRRADHAARLRRCGCSTAIPLLRRIPGRLIGLGVRRERVRSPDA